jgi:hypothetical protein
MPASTPASPSRAPQRRLRDADGVSEVVGHVLIFGIVSMLLVASMLAFNVAQQGARDRVVQLRAESAATRVAGVVVQASIVQERQSATPGASAEVRHLVDLPAQLEGLPYTVALQPADASHSARVLVTVPLTKQSATAALFSADAPSGIDVCSSQATGGNLYVAFDKLSPCSASVAYLYVKSVP